MLTVSCIGLPEQSVYSATKFAIWGMTQCAALDYGKYGITVNSYAPGVIETPLSKCLYVLASSARSADMFRVAVDYLDEYHTSKNGQPRGSWTKSVRPASYGVGARTPCDTDCVGLQFNSLSALGRNGHPEDVAKLVSFLVSDDAAFVTGTSHACYIVYAPR